jgi:hypothetical protein
MKWDDDSHLLGPVVPDTSSHVRVRRPHRANAIPRPHEVNDCNCSCGVWTLDILHECVLTRYTRRSLS